MKPRLGWALNLLVTLAILLATFPLGVQADDVDPLRPVVGSAVHHDLSPPLRDMPAVPAAPISQQATDLPLPKTAQGAALLWEDSAVQDRPGELSMPSPIADIEGVNNVNGVLPPDTQGDIGYDPATGTKYYVQWVNLSFAIWDVTNTPTQIYGPVAGNTLWQGFGGPCETTNHGDPITLYDTLSNRWLMSQFSINGPYYQCIAISQTADPTGAWHRYGFMVSSNKMNDYPHFGVWPDGYYMTVNQFTNGAYWGGAGVFVFERDKMLNGQAASFQYFDLYSVDYDFGGMLPSDLDGANLPPAGSPNYFLEVDDSTWIGPTDAIRLWEFHVDWNTPSNSTFGINGQPNAILDTAPFTPLCISTSSCIPQPGTSQKLDAIGDRLMYRLAYRNFGSHESLVVNHTVNAGSGKAGVRWYELRDPSGSPSIYQQGTYAPDAENRWMGSVAMDQMGNMALGYSVSSSSVYPSIRYTGRLADDPLGEMSMAEEELIAGGGSQTSYHARWGDYSMMGIDPVDDCTFWYTTEYLQTTGNAPWRTRIGAFRFPDCGGPSPPDPGTLDGTVSDSGTGLGLGGAVIEVQSDAGQTAQTTSAPDGSYALSLEPATYTVTAAALGYLPYFTSGIEITSNVTNTLNIALDPAPTYAVSGQVIDAQTGWPLYAHMAVEGDLIDPPPPNDDLWTDPVTGAYVVNLTAGTTYTFQVSAWVDGYSDAFVTVGPLTGDLTRDIALEADVGACTAPGYTSGSGVGLVEPFDNPSTPAGWSVVNNGTAGAVWRFDDPDNRGNKTGGEGNFAIIDSDYAGTVAVDTELHAPSLDFSTVSDVFIEFQYDFYWYTYGLNEVADVDVSVDGGGSWTNVWRRTSGSDRGPKLARVDISSLAAGESDVRVRFHYYNAEYEWWWQVDDVRIGELVCDSHPGGLVVGQVTDGNTGQALPGSQVANDAGYAVLAATTLDPAVGDGFYTLFAPAGTRTLTGTNPGGYGAAVESVSVVLGGTVEQNLALPAGILSAAPEAISLTLLSGVTTTRDLLLDNSGGVAADFTIEMINAPLRPLPPDGPFAPAVRRTSPKHIHDLDARSVRIYEPPTAQALDAGQVVEVWDSGLETPWGLAVDPAGDLLWLSNPALGRGDDADHGFQLDGTPADESIDTSPWVALYPADMTYDPLTGRIWQVNVGGDNCIYELDPASLEATGRKLCPGFGVSERGLAYDPVSDSFISGSWVDQTVHRFDSSGQMIESYDTRLNISGLAYNPMTAHLFVMSSADSGYDVYVLDVGAEYAVVGGFDVDGLGAFEQAGLDLDCDGNLWAVNQVTGEVIKVLSGETAPCSWNAVPWLSADPSSGSLPAGGDDQVSLTVDATALDEGIYPAHLRIVNSTPYGAINVPITLTVQAQYQVVLTPGEATQYGDPGDEVVTVFEVGNEGLASDTYTVTVEGDDWVAMAPEQVGPVAAGEQASLPVTVTIPVDALSDASDTITVSVTSQGDPARVDQAVLTIVADPVYGVSLSPPTAESSGLQGQEVAYTLDLTNEGNIGDAYLIGLVGQEWSTTVSSGSVALDPGEHASLVVTVTVPVSAAPGTQDVIRLAATGSGASAYSDLTTTADVDRGLTVKPPDDWQSAKPGETVTYTLRLTNTGSYTDTFSTSPVGADWDVSMFPAEITLATGGYADLQVEVTAPLQALAGLTDTVTATVASLGDPAVVGSVRITTTVGVHHAVSITSTPDTGSASTGKSITYTLEVGNLGNVQESYQLSAAGNHWPVQLAVTELVLAPYASQEIALRVDVPLTATVGYSDTVQVSAVGVGASDLVTVTTLAEADWFWVYLPVVVRSNP